MRFVGEDAACTLVIPTRDRADRLLMSLRRIADTPGPDVEVIVADNGSIDGTVKRLREAFPAVRPLTLDGNLGTAARNEAVKIARTSIVVMLDDDSGPEPGAVEAMIDTLDDSNVGIAAAHVRLPDGQCEEGGSRFVHIGCGAAFRKETFLAYGGYPTEYETYVEEYDLAYRLVADGLTVRWLDDAVVWHEPAARTSYDYMVEKLVANNAYLAAKFFPWPNALTQISWSLFRYGRFAHKHGALAGYRRAMEKLPQKILRGQAHHQPLPEAALSALLPERQTVGTFADLRMDGAKEVVFLRAGKEIPGLITAARHAGLRVKTVFEPPDGLLSDVDHLFDVPVRPLTTWRSESKTVCVVGGTSPGFVRNTLDLARLLGTPAPVIP